MTVTEPENGYRLATELGDPQMVLQWGQLKPLEVVTERGHHPPTRERVGALVNVYVIVGLPYFAVYNAHPWFLCTLYTGLLFPWYVIIMPMYDVHPYFSLKTLGKSMHITYGKIQHILEGAQRKLQEGQGQCMPLRAPAGVCCHFHTF